MVHEEVVDHWAQLRRQAGQEVHHAEPRHGDLRPGDVEREQHQEAEQRDSWVKKKKQWDDEGHCVLKTRKVLLKHTRPMKRARKLFLDIMRRQALQCFITSLELNRCSLNNTWIYGGPGYGPVQWGSQWLCCANLSSSCQNANYMLKQRSLAVNNS